MDASQHAHIIPQRITMLDGHMLYKNEFETSSFEQFHGKALHCYKSLDLPERKSSLLSSTSANLVKCGCQATCFVEYFQA